MRCYFPAAIALLMSLSAFGSNAYGGDTDLMRWLGIGWGPGYHAYSNSGPCANGYASPYGWYGGGPPGQAGDFRPAPTYREPLPPSQPREPMPQANPEPTAARSAAAYRPPMYGPAFSPPLVKPSEQAARAGRYFPPSPEYSPTYVGQRYPGVRF
jgi:hypothetical protein